MKVRSTMRCSISLYDMLSTISLLLLLSFHQSFVTADYVIMLKDQVLYNPNNTDAQGNCCNDTEGTSNCITPCDVGVCICIRPSGFDPLNRSDCPILRLLSRIDSNPSINVVGPWMGGVQILLTIEDMDEDLVDMFLIELNGTAAASNESVSVTTREYAGLNGIATLEVSTAVMCHNGFYGPSCDCQGRDDASGHFTCNGAGERVCLQGYQNLMTNCTECVPAEGCSPVGGFCEQPGECICHEDYSGDNCATGPLSSSTEDLLLPFSTLLLLEPFSTPSVSTPTMMSSLVMTSSPEMLSSSELPSSSSVASLPAMTSSSRVASSPATTSSPALKMDNVASSTVLPQPSSSAQPPTTSLAVSTPLFSSPLFLSPTPSPFISSPSSQPTMTSLPTPPLPSPSTASSSVPSVPATPSSSENQPSSSVTGSLPVAPSSTDGMVLSSPPPIPVTSTTTSPPAPHGSTTVTVATPTGGGQGGEGAGNVGAIVGAVMLIVAVLVLILIFVICIYVKMTNRKRKKQKRSMFLDQVYNTPVMFVNPEGAIPRSPQLIMQGEGGIGLRGGQEGGGGRGGGGGADFVGDPEPRALDVTNKGTFPDIAYKAHEPYAERGPIASREPSSSDETPQLYQMSEHDSTVFVNPNTEQPNLLARPEGSNQQRRSGLGFDYKDDPIGDAYLTEQFQEQALGVGGQGVGGQSNGHMNRWDSGQGHVTAYGSGRGYTSRHQNGNHSKYTNGQPSTLTHRPMPLAPPPLPRPRKLRESASPKRLGKKYGGQDVEEREQVKAEQELKSSNESTKGERMQKEEMKEREKEEDVVDEKRKEKGKREGEEEEEEEEEGDDVQQRAAQYLQIAQEQSEKRQSYMQDILFTDINLDMSTQTEL